MRRRVTAWGWDESLLNVIRSSKDVLQPCGCQIIEVTHDGKVRMDLCEEHSALFRLPKDAPMSIGFAVPPQPPNLKDFT